MRFPRSLSPRCTVLLALLSTVAFAPLSTVAGQDADSILVAAHNAYNAAKLDSALASVGRYCRTSKASAYMCPSVARQLGDVKTSDAKLAVAFTPAPTPTPVDSTPKDSTPVVVTPPDSTPTQPPSSAFVVPAGLGGGLAKVAELPRDTAPTPYPTTTTLVRVPAGANLQQVLNQAQPGDLISLAPGATYTGDFQLPKHAGAGQATCTQWIVLRTDVSDSLLGAPGVRMTPSRAAALKLAKLQTPDNQQAIGSAWSVANVGCWRLVGLEILPGPTSTDVNGLVRFGDQNITDSTKMAHHLVVDRSYVHGSSTPSPKNASPMLPGQVRRCFILNARWAVVVDSWAEFCRGGSGDTQAVLSYMGGPIRLTNNTLSGGTEVVMFGGANGGVMGAVASDITIHGNLITRALADTVTLVKALLETKCSDRMDVAGNVLRLNWIDGQDGQAVNAKSVNQSSGIATWCHTGNFTFRYNRVAQSSNGLKLAGIQEAPAQPAGPYTVYGNVIDSLNFRPKPGEGGRPFTILGGGSLYDLTLAYNTVPPAAWGLMVMDGGQAIRVAIHNNALYCGGYGIKGNSTPSGTQSIAAFLAPYTWQTNALFGCSSGYPSGTTYTSSLSAAVSIGVGADATALTAALRNAIVAP